jgi:hypothetical protein
MANLQHHTFEGNEGIAIGTAFLLPLGSIFAFSRKRTSNGSNPLQLLGVFVLLIGTAVLVVGCSSSSSSSSSTPPATPTPTGMQQVTITATSGSIKQTATIGLTVQ